MPSYETFTFKGINSNEYGVLMSDEWLDSIPARRYDTAEVDGRDGAIYTELGLSDVAVDIPCILRDSANKEAVKAWLTGSGTLIFGNRQKTAKIFAQIDFTRIGSNSESFSLPLILAPYWDKVGGGVFTNLGTLSEGESVTVTNEGNTPSFPVVRITPTGDVTVIVGTRSFSIDASKLTGEKFTLFCDQKRESDPQALSGIGFTYPSLAPGENLITLSSGTSATVEIAYKDRWI